MGDIYFVDDSEYKNPETLALHGGNYRFDPVTSAVTVPIYRSTSFQFRDTENAANLFFASGIRQHLQSDHESN